MSAIAGLWHRDGAPASRTEINGMMSALRHYGTEASSVRLDGSAAMGHCRMELFAKDAQNAQPLSYANGRFHLLADLRLDNRETLATAFGLSPAQEAGASDAELLARALERWGTSCFQHILGDYSFALWDRTERSWLLARDAVGSLPLYYFLDRSFLAFASMPVGLLALPQVPCQVHEEWISQMLELMPRPMASSATGMSSFDRIGRVPAGHFIRITQQGAERLQQHWEPSGKELRLSRPEAYHEALREHLDRAVTRRLRGAVDVASHLSGGLDSASVCATAARAQQQRGARVVAYTSIPQEPVGQEFHNRFADERDHAAGTAALYPNVDHVLITGRGRSPWHALHESFQLYQQPVLNLCNQGWTAAILNNANGRGLHVLLTGNAGNFTISGTGFDMLPGMARQGRWRELYSILAGLHRERGMSWKSLALRTLAPWMPTGALAVATRYMKIVRLGSAVTQDLSLLHPDRKARREHLAPPRPFESRVDHIAWRMFLLQRGDAAALRKGTLARWRIDERDPTSDRELIEFCLSVPATEWMRGGLPSALLRDGMSDRLPRKVRYETRKGSQGTDWHIEATLARPQLLLELEALEASPAVGSYVDLPRLRALAKDWPANNWQGSGVNAAYRGALLRSLSVGRFIRDVSEMNEGRHRRLTSLEHLQV